MTSRCDSNPAQYERNRGIRHLRSRHYTTVAGSWDRLRKSNFSKSVELNQTALAIPLRMTTLESIEAQRRAVNTLRSDETHPGNRFARRRIKKNFFFIPFVYLGEFRGMEDGKNFPSPTMGSFSIRYNCMQQLIAPSATCDSNAKDRTKLQLQFPRKNWTPTNTSGLSKKSWDMKKVRPAYIGDRVATPQTPRPKLTCVHVVSVCYHMQTTSRQPKGPRVTVNITTLFKVHCDRNVIVEWTFQKKLGYEKSSTCIYRDRVATPQTPRPKLTCVHVVSVCYHMQTTSRQPKGPRVTVNITTLFKVHCDRNVIVEWTFQKKLGYEKSSTCIYRDRVATPQTPRPKLTCVHVVSVCYHMQTTSRQPKGPRVTVNITTLFKVHCDRNVIVEWTFQKKLGYEKSSTCIYRDRVATPQTPRPKLTCVHVVSVCYHMQTTSRQPKGPRVTVNITTLFKVHCDRNVIVEWTFQKKLGYEKSSTCIYRDRVATPQTPRPKLTCVHVVSVCYHMQTTSRQPKGPRVTVNITTLFKTGTLLLSGLSKKSWDMKKVRPAYIRDRVATPQTPRPKLTCVHVVSVCYHMQTTSRQPKGPRVTVNITTLFKTGTLLLSGLSKKSWDMKKVRPAYIGDRVATPQTPRPKLTCVHVVSVCYHMQTTSRQPKGHV
ncbi:hypothetical protein TPS_06138 [Trichinella pseudospiralis]